MSWHYQIRQRTMPDGSLFYDIVEVFTDPMGWTVDGVGAAGDSPLEVIADLRRMLADTERYPILEDPDQPESGSRSIKGVP